MSALVNELKSDHVKLVGILEKVRSVGLNSPEGLTLLKSAKAGLLAHLAKEDAKLYPTLKKAAESDKEVKSTLDFFASDMEKVSKAALDFFAKYENGGSGIEFGKDIGALMHALGTRIRREEEKLYPLHDKKIA